MRRSTAIAGSNVIIQVIEVRWDKSARGGRLAELRNRIPSNLMLDAQLQPDIGKHLLVHETHWSVQNEFHSERETKHRILEWDESFRYRCATIRRIDDGIQMDWQWREWGGIPPRTHRTSGPAGLIAADGQYVRAKWNVRHTCPDTGIWSYESIIVNAGFCETNDIPRDFFTRTEPIACCNEMAYLR